MDFGTRRIAKPGHTGLMTACLAAGLLSACLKPDAVGGSPQVEEPAEVLEPILLAGATSSTNWPEEPKHRTSVTVMGRADSVITLVFARAREQSEGYDRVSLSGTLTLFDGSTIPALDTVPSATMDFADVDSVVIPVDLIHSLPAHGRDTLGFGILLKVDTTQCFIGGFLHRKSTGKIIHSIFPENPPSAFQLLAPRHGYSAEVDTAGVTHLFPPSPSAEMSFYIPGSPFYWRPEPFGSITLGPLSEGPYPLRLILASPASGDSSATHVAIFEVSVRKLQPGINGQPSKPPAFIIGRELASTVVSGRLRLRPASP
jgi:hypothetical protein